MARSPIIGLAGKAGSGKSTAAKYIVDEMGGIEVAQADVMKRLLWRVFDFSSEQLWGPSEERNKEVDLTRKKSEITINYNKTVGPWVDDLLHVKFDLFEKALDNWFHAQELIVSPRKLLQTLGTDVVRQLSATVWSDYALATAFKLLGGGFKYFKEVGLVEDPKQTPYSLVVISDVRFLNETININKVNGTVIRIKSDATSNSTHASETELDSIPSHFYDETIWNYKTLAFYSKVDDTIRKYYPNFKY
jgi:hypothetical protein